MSKFSAVMCTATLLAAAGCGSSEPPEPTPPPATQGGPITVCILHGIDAGKLKTISREDFEYELHSNNLADCPEATAPAS